MSFYIEERKLWKARWEYVLRLAKWLGVRPPRAGCSCLSCKVLTIRAVARRIQ